MKTNSTMHSQQNQALLEDLIGELNDPGSLTRAEITASDISEVLPKGKAFIYRPPVERVCRSCGAKITGICDCQFGE